MVFERINSPFGLPPAGLLWNKIAAMTVVQVF
jgi:hypothetical protein